MTFKQDFTEYSGQSIKREGAFANCVTEERELMAAGVYEMEKEFFETSDAEHSNSIKG